MLLLNSIKKASVPCASQSAGAGKRALGDLDEAFLINRAVCEKWHHSANLALNLISTRLP